MKKQILTMSAVFLFLIVGTILVALYGKGYRFGFSDGGVELSGTGLLVATSVPNGAQVFINGHLTTATDNTINLSPQEYSVKIFKDGYFPWEKKIKIQKEVVAKAEALLFPTAPKLESITASGVENPTLDPSKTRIAYTVGSKSTRKNGVYVLDMSSRPILTLQSASTQIADDTIDAFSKATLAWSADGQELLATISAATSVNTYLLKANEFNESPKDVTATLEALQNSWENERLEKEKARINTLKPALRKLISENFDVIAWPPDETKILYQASTSASLPIVIKPRLVGVEATPEDRELKEGSIYVYDIREDKNYKLDIGNLTFDIGNSQGVRPLGLSWLPDSKHLIFVHDKKIEIVEYAGTNPTTVYAGPFIDNYVFPWTNESKIVILTNLGNPNILPNLYTVGLK